MAGLPALIESLIPHTRETTQQRLARQLAELRHEVDALSGHLTREGLSAGRHLTHSAADLSRELIQRSAPIARAASEQALKAGDAVRKDPVPAIVWVASLALLWSLFFADRKQG